MVLEVPFVRYGFERDPHSMTCFYYVRTAQGATENIGRAIDTGASYVLYKQDLNFARNYGDRLPPGDIDEWDLPSDFIRWIQSIIYYSFLRCSKRYFQVRRYGRRTNVARQGSSCDALSGKKVCKLYFLIDFRVIVSGALNAAVGSLAAATMGSLAAMELLLSYMIS